MEEIDFWQVTKTNVTLFKGGAEIATGFICFSIYENVWDEEDEYHERQEDESIMIYNGKEVTDYDYDETLWDEEREIFESENYSEVQDYYKDLIKDLIVDDVEILNENGLNVVFEGNHGVYYKFNKVNGKVDGLKEKFCRASKGFRPTLLMSSNYSEGKLHGLQTTFYSYDNAYNDYERTYSPIQKIEVFKNGELTSEKEFNTLNLYFHHIVDKDHYQNESVVELQNELIALLFNEKISKDDAKQKLFLFASSKGLIIEGGNVLTENPTFVKIQNQLIMDSCTGKISDKEAKSKIQSYVDSLT